MYVLLGVLFHTVPMPLTMRRDRLVLNSVLFGSLLGDRDAVCAMRSEESSNLEVTGEVECWTERRRCQRRRPDGLPLRRICLGR